MRSTRDQRLPIGSDIVATTVVIAFSLSVATGFGRVFSGWEFMADMAILVIVGHGSSFVLRRNRMAAWFAVPTCIVGLIWTLTLLRYRSTSHWLIPTGDTFDWLRLDVGLARQQFPTAVAPVIYGAGWAVLAGFIVIVVIAITDAFAFLGKARGETVAPGAALFVFISALGSSRFRLSATTLLVATGVVCVITLRKYNVRDHRSEVGRSSFRRTAAVTTALATAAAVALFAGLIGPLLPGAYADPLYETRGRNAAQTEAASPLVDIRSRLTNRGNVELFRVRTDVDAYWRVTTLPYFDGQTFQSTDAAMAGAEDESGLRDVPTQEVRQEILVAAYGNQFLPAAADPIAASGSTPLRYNVDTGTLIAPRDLTPGDLFTIVSDAPRPTIESLRAATTSDLVGKVFLGLPDDLADIVGELARDVTKTSATGYDAAIALQSWFRSEFTYSLEVQQGHGSSAIESFLIGRIGYCEQFAATFAVMARVVGIPSRVAVGYTPGVRGEDGWLSVIGRNAHAWPELWFDGIGWIAFEPTPGRGAPNADYTGLEAQQDTLRPVSQPGTTPRPDVTEPRAPTTTTLVPTQTFPTDTLVPTEIETSSNAGLDHSSIALVAMFVVAAGTAAPWAARRVRRSRANRQADAGGRIRLAWQRATLAATTAGVLGKSSTTSSEWAKAIAAHLVVAARPIWALADAYDRFLFSENFDTDYVDAFGNSISTNCDLWSHQIDKIVTDTLTPRRRVVRYFTEWR